MVRPRTVMLMTFVAAVVVFAAVQDRVTASGARQYETRQRAALAVSGPPVTIDQVMVPVVASSVREGLAWSGGVAAAGLAGALATAQGRRG